MPKPPQRRSSSSEIDRFLTRTKTLALRPEDCPRLLFAIDATASRQPTWDQACQLQGEMFLATRHLGGLAVQLCYYHGLMGFQSSPWLVDEAALLSRMSRVRCEGGYTQIARVLDHALVQHRQAPVKALIFIGDACEEDPATLTRKAGELGLAGLPLFMFQEGRDSALESLFRQMAKLSGGAWARFDQASARELADLLGAVARYAAGGRESLLEYGAGRSQGVTLLLEQLKQG